jgi:hypothetical protein
MIPKSLRIQLLLSNSEQVSSVALPPIDGVNEVNEVEVLRNKISELERTIESNKVFTYMVIHDLKHPTESMISSL